MKNKKESKLPYSISDIENILSIKNSFNEGLTQKLKNKFPNLHYTPRPTVNVTQIPDPHWLLGFIDGDACFSIRIYKSTKIPNLSFVIDIDIRDKPTLELIQSYLHSGLIRTIKTRPNNIKLIISSFHDIFSNLLPLFSISQFPLITFKYFDYLDFFEAANILFNKQHITSEGKLILTNLKFNMNTGRIFLFDDFLNIRTIQDHYFDSPVLHYHPSSSFFFILFSFFMDSSTYIPFLDS